MNNTIQIEVSPLARNRIKNLAKINAQIAQLEDLKSATQNSLKEFAELPADVEAKIELVSKKGVVLCTVSSYEQSRLDVKSIATKYPAICAKFYVDQIVSCVRVSQAVKNA